MVFNRWIRLLIWGGRMTLLLFWRLKSFFHHRILIPLFYKLILKIYHQGILKLFYTFRLMASRIVNYSIYYFFLFIRKPIPRQERAAKKARKETDLPLQNAVPKAVSHHVQAAVNAPPQFDLPTTLTRDNHIVHGMWIGSHLSKIELLTIKSFLRHQHRFHLWVYDKLDNCIPEGAVLCDANEIIPRDQIFRYEKFNKYGHGMGSVAGFSDIFRYKLLYEKGGWWADMDICCLKPHNFQQPYFFRDHHNLKVMGNLMKCPPGSELMKDCYETACREIDARNKDWHKPVQILNDNIWKYALEGYIVPGVTNPDIWDILKYFLIRDEPIPDHYFAIHWINEEWRSKGLNKNNIRQSSTLGKLLMEYGLMQPLQKKKDIFFHELKHGLVNRLRIEL